MIIVLNCNGCEGLNGYGCSQSFDAVSGKMQPCPASLRDRGIERWVLEPSCAHLIKIGSKYPAGKVIYAKYNQFMEDLRE